jgi:DNA-binding GntR family transcriptional regulator
MPSSLAEYLKLKIENEILMFNLKPGDRLDECRLADRFGSSRTPVREALRLLAAEGFVRIRPHRGAVVSGLTVAELVDMFEMMAIYEGVCARLAAVQATAEEIAEMTAAQEECRKQSEAGNLSAYCLANARFHEAIYNASHNRYLIKRTTSTRNRLGAYRRVQMQHDNRMREFVGEHDAVLAAIKAAQAEEADRLMRKHIATRGAQVTALITSLPPEYFDESAKTQPQPILPPGVAHKYPAAALTFS